MRTQIRIVAGSLRGRKVECTVSPSLRPTPHRTREALFSILGDAVPERPFFDVFAGTGVVGMEAISRGATLTTFVERDFKLIEDIERHLKAFKVLASARVLRADVYRWADRWQPPADPATVFLSPPFPDLESRADEMLAMVTTMQERLAPGSVLVLQCEMAPLIEKLPDRQRWDERKYGRNRLLFWVKPIPPAPDETTDAPPPLSEREFAVEVVRTLRDAGHDALFAGGCVRDELLGLEPKDHDVATSALPEQVQRLFRRTIAVGVSFGVVEVLGPRPHRIQVATFRKDGDYSDARRPDSVVFCGAEEDAKRRDFTINGMFLDPLEGRVIDYVGGQDDLRARVLRAIGDPYERFREDRLRVLRGVRMAARFEMEIEPHTRRAIEERAATLGEGVSAERIAEELRKMLVDRHRARAMRLFMGLGLAAVVMDELLPMRGLPQGQPRAETTLPAPGMPGPPLPGDLWEHTCAVLDELGGKPSFPLAMAALLHDAGKPRTVGRTPDRYTFHGHEHVGRRMAKDIGLRLRLSNDERERIEWLVEKHQVLADAPKMRPAKLKGLLVHPGIEELIALHRADARASGRDEEAIDLAVRLRDQWDQEGTLSPPPLLDGNDLMALGIPPGPIYKVLLRRVREAQLDGTIRTKEEAIELVRRLLAEGLSEEEEGEPPL